MDKQKHLEVCLCNLASYAATALTHNTEDWMDGLIDHLNEAAVLVDPTAVFIKVKSNATGDVRIEIRRIP